MLRSGGYGEVVDAVPELEGGAAAGPETEGGAAAAEVEMPDAFGGVKRSRDVANF